MLRRRGSGGMSLDEIYAMFPNLKERRTSPGMRLSGEQPDARASPHPAHRRQAAAAGRDLRRPGAIIVQAWRHDRMLREKGFTIVMVEQNFRFAAPLADPSTSWSTAGSSRLSLLRNWKPRKTCCTSTWASNARSFFRRKRTNRRLMKRKLISTLWARRLLWCWRTSAQVSDGVIKIGGNDDMSSLYADIGGPGSTLAARMRSDFGAAKKGMKVESSPRPPEQSDVGSSVARQCTTSTRSTRSSTCEFGRGLRSTS